MPKNENLFVFLCFSIFRVFVKIIIYTKDRLDIPLFSSSSFDFAQDDSNPKRLVIIVYLSLKTHLDYTVKCNFGVLFVLRKQDNQYTTRI